MIETYGVDISPVKEDEDYKDIKDDILSAYVASLARNEEYLDKFKDVERSCDRLYDLINRYQLDKIELRKELKFVNGIAPKTVSLMICNKPSGMSEDDIVKIVFDLGEHISKGLAVMKPFVETFQKVTANLTAHCEETERFAAADRTAIGFWQNMLELMELEYVFVHAEMKYKKKVCKECIKKAKVIVASADIELTRLRKRKDPDGKPHPLISTIEAQVARARNRIKVFTEIRDEADANGIESGFRIWQEAKFVRMSKSGG